MKVLVLGGTLEARHICTALVARGHEVTLSLKGLTAKPLIPKGVRHREGGFGGVAGLARESCDYDALIDATHPFAAGMSWNAYRGSAVPLLALQRPAWQRQPGDRWTSISSLKKAVTRLSSLPSKRILLALGGQGAELFRVLPQHAFTARVLASSKTDLATRYAARWRGLELQRFSGRPTLAGEMATLRGKDLMILRNAGGPMDAKLTAARRLKTPVWIMDRPAMPPVPIYGSVAALVAALDAF